MTPIIIAFILVFFAGFCSGNAFCTSRYIQGLKDARDYAESLASASAQAARRAIDTKEEILGRIHRLYEHQRRTAGNTHRYRVARFLP